MEQTPNQPSAAPVETAVETPTTETLESIAQTLTVEEQANQFVSSVQPNIPQYQQPPSYQPQPFVAPDPVTDPDGYRSFIAKQYDALTKLNSTVEQVSSKIGEWERTQIEQKVNKDVDMAVSKVADKLKGMDRDMVEVALELEYRKNPSFKKIWDARDRNGQALDRALEILSGKLSSKYQVKTDPQLAENLRAAKSAQLTTGSTKAPEGLDQMDEQAFQKFWQGLTGQGNF